MVPPPDQNPGHPVQEPLDRASDVDHFWGHRTTLDLIRLSHPLGEDEQHEITPAMRARATADLRLIDDIWPTHYKVLNRVVSVADERLDRGMLVFHLRDRLSRIAMAVRKPPLTQSLNELDDDAVRSLIEQVGRPFVDKVVAAGIVSAIEVLAADEAAKSADVLPREEIVRRQVELEQRSHDAKEQGRHALVKRINEEIQALENRKMTLADYNARRHAALTLLAKLVRHPTEGERHRAAVMYCPKGGDRALVPELATLSTDEAMQITSRTRGNSLHKATSSLRSKLAAATSIHPTTPPRSAWAFWDVAV